MSTDDKTVTQSCGGETPLFPPPSCTGPPRHGGEPEGKRAAGRRTRRYEEKSGYQAMWLFVMFDLPVDTQKARREYTRFRKNLLKAGFSMLQYSVYARYYSSEETCRTCKNYVRSVLPPEGQVRLLSVTDVQFGKMEVFIGKSRKPPEDAPVQLMLF